MIDSRIDTHPDAETTTNKLKKMTAAQFREWWQPISQNIEELKRIPQRVRTYCVERSKEDAPWVEPSSKSAAKKLSKVTTLPDTVHLIRGDTIEPRAIYWVWPYYVPRGKLTILAGPPGLGKTTLALAMAAAVSIGGRLPDGSRAQVGNVLIWTGEDNPEDTLVPRLIAMGADMRRIFFVSNVVVNGESYAFDPSRDLDALTLRAAEIGDIALLMIDPIVSAVAGDSHKNSETRRGLQPVIDLASRLDCAVIGISHYSKGTQGRDPVERVTGSLAFGAVARVVLACAKGQDGEKRRMVRAKSNCGPDGGGFEYDLIQAPVTGYDLTASTVLWGSALEGEARDLLAEVETLPDDASQSNGTAVWLRDFLSANGGQCAKGEVLKAALANGHKQRTVERACKKIGVEVRMNGFAKNKVSIWSLPNLATLPQYKKHGEYGEYGEIDTSNSFNLANLANLASKIVLGECGEIDEKHQSPVSAEDYRRVSKGH